VGELPSVEFVAAMQVGPSDLGEKATDGPDCAFLFVGPWLKTARRPAATALRG
jgi:hypothetical protein